MIFSLSTYRDLVGAFTEVGADPANRVVVLIGTGDSFVGGADLGPPEESFTPNGYDAFLWHGSRLAQRLLDIQAPVLCALNGPTLLHTELPFLCDIVLSTPEAYFEDVGHLPGGIVPGDGVQTIWAEVLGPLRMRAFLWLRQRVTARELLARGAIAELVEFTSLEDRAMEIARDLAALPSLTLRYTSLVVKQEMKRRFANEVSYGMALEGLTVVNALLNARSPTRSQSPGTP